MNLTLGARFIMCLLRFNFSITEITRAAGIEPTQMVLKTNVLPLNYTPEVTWAFTTYGFRYNCTTGGGEALDIVVVHTLAALTAILLKFCSKPL